MATQEQMQQEDKQFSESFKEDGAAPVEQSEDDAFGITPEATPEETQEAGMKGDAGVATGGLDAGDTGIAPAPADAIEAAGIPATEESAAAAGAEGVGEPSGEDWEQKYRTLQGKYDAEVKGKSAASAEEPASGGDMTAEDAERSLTEDFGPEFVRALVAICAKHSTSAVGDVSANVEAIIAHMTDEAQMRHFKAISSAHPDFMEVNESAEFQEWKAAKTPKELHAIEQTLATGSAEEVNAVLDEFKASRGSSETGDDTAAEAGEGVRSGGIRLPEAPTAGSDDYEAAWNQG